jgi:hypothetical protein
MDFYNVFLNAHKGIGYLVLLLVIVFTLSLLVCMFGYSGKISKLLKKSTLFTMIAFHTQVLVGVPLLLIFSPGFKAALAGGTLMKDAYARHTYVEHPFSMIVAAVLLTIIYRYMKTHDTIAMKIVIMGVVAVAFFAYAFPWMRVFGA